MHKEHVVIKQYQSKFMLKEIIKIDPLTSWCTDSFESELIVPDKGPTGRLRLLARLTIVATVRQ